MAQSQYFNAGRVDRNKGVDVEASLNLSQYSGGFFKSEFYISGDIPEMDLETFDSSFPNSTKVGGAF